MTFQRHATGHPRRRLRQQQWLGRINNGSVTSSVLNVVPWILTVGASMVDRCFPTTMYHEGLADNAHDFAVGESLADRTKSHGSSDHDLTARMAFVLFSFNASAVLFIEPKEVGYTMILDNFGQRVPSLSVLQAG